MKKYLSAIAALCLCPAAWAADIYITGHENNWTLDDEFKLQQSGEIYSIHLDLISAEKFPYGFKIAESGWAKQYGTKEVFPLDKTAKCVEGDGNNFYVPDDIKSITGATIVFDKTDAVNPTLTIRPDLYLAGSINSWANTNADYRFAYTNGTYSLALDNLDGEFRIAAGVNDQNDDWLINYGGAQNMSAGNTYDCIEGSGNNMSLADGSKENIILSFDKDNKKLTVSRPDAGAFADGVFLSCAENNWWSNHPDYRFTENGTTYTLHLASLPSEFKVVTSGWEYQFGMSGAFIFDKPMTCTNGWGSNFTLPDGITAVAGATLTLDIANLAAPTLTVMPDLYLAGEVTGWSNTKEGYRFAEKDGIYTLAMTELTGEFRIAGGTTPEWLVKFGGAKNMSKGNTYNIAANSDDNMSLASGSTSNVLLSFDKANRTLAVADINTESFSEGLYLALEIDGTWWSDHPDYRFTESNGIYRLHVDALPSEFKVTTPDWEQQFGTPDGLVFGQPMACTEGWGGNFVLPEGVTSVAGATITVNLTNMVSPVITVMPDLYLAGEINSWHNNDAEYRFAETDGTYRLSVKGLTGKFRIAGGTSPEWPLQYGAQENMSVGNSYACIKGSGNDMSLSGSNDVTLSFNPADLTLAIAEYKAPAAGAELYLAHEIDGTWWSNHPDFKFTESNGVYRLHVDDLPSEFKITTADWGTQYGTNSTFVFGKPMTCQEMQHGGNFVRPSEYTTIAGALITLDLSGNVPTATIIPDLYLAGDINDWNNTNSAYRFTENNGIYTLAVGELYDKFRIAGGTAPEWAINFGGAQNMEPGQTYDCIEGSGNDMTVAGGSIRNAMLTFDYNARKLTIGSISTEGAKDGLYLAGTINNWASDNASYRFTENGGIYTLTVPRLSGEFKIVTKDWSLQFGCDSKIEYGHEYSCFHTSNGSNISLVDNVGIDVVLTFDLENMILTADGVPTLYLVGDFNNWTVSPLYAFGYDNGVYTLKTSDFNGAFKVVTADNSLQFGTHFGLNLDLGREYALMDSGADMTFGGLPSRASSRVKITVRANGTPFNGSVSGIEDVDASCAGANVEYYNLQGVRVANPGNGFYIKRTGSVIEKIYVK